jgi:hypothetical protein
VWTGPAPLPQGLNHVAAAASGTIVHVVGGFVRQNEGAVRYMGLRRPGRSRLQLAPHPRTVDLREYDVLEPLNAWIGHLFDRRNVDRTVAALVASQDGGGTSSEREAAKKRLADAEKRLRRFQDAIAAGIDPDALAMRSTRHRRSGLPRRPSWSALSPRPASRRPRSTP